MSIKTHLFLILLAVWSSQGEDVDLEPADGSIDPSTRVVGGSKAPEGAVPYLAALKDKSKYQFCGSSIIADRWILTAAHCIRNLKSNDFVAVAGTNSRSKGGTEYKIDKIIIHPKSTNKPQVNDIALLRTVEKITFTEKVKAIKLPTRATKEGATALLAGWGFVDQRGRKVDDNLQWLNVTVESQDKCKNTFKQYVDTYPVTDDHLCTLNKAGEGTCQGDSGGGLKENDEVVGVTSWNIPCARGRPDVFARVYNYVSWIEKTMKETK